MTPCDRLRNLQRPCPRPVLLAFVSSGIISFQKRQRLLCFLLLDLTSVTFALRADTRTLETLTGGLANTSGTNGDLVLVQGYSRPGDGGGGWFAWKGTTVDATNRGTVFAGANGYWIRLLVGSEINVKWFGASAANHQNDDDTQSIQSAAEYLYE